MRAGLSWVSAVALLAVANPAQAQVSFRLPGFGQTSFSFTNTTLLTYRRTNFDSVSTDDNLLSLTERFDSQFTAPPWRLQVRIDAFVPVLLAPPGTTPGSVNAPSFCATSAMGMATCPADLHWDARVERVALSYSGEQVSVDIGDFYAAIGRGLMLSLRKVDPLGTDTTIRGGNFTAELERFTVRAMAGYINVQNLDPLTLVTVHDYGEAIARGRDSARTAPDLLGGLDRIAAADILARIGENNDVEVGLAAARVIYPESFGRDSAVDTFGYRMAVPLLFDGGLALYGEVIGLRRTQSEYFTSGSGDTVARGARARAATEFGRATYLSAQINAGNWSAQLEFKDYVNFLLSPDGGGSSLRRIYNNAPPLEREDVQFRSNSNTRGALVRIERAFRPSPWVGGITLVGSGFTESNGLDPWDPSGFGVAHGYLSLRRNVDGADYSTASTVGGAMGAVGAAQAPRVAGASWQLAANAGYRMEFIGSRRGVGCRTGNPRDGCREAYAPDWHIAHADIDVAFPLAANHSLEVRVDGRVETRFDDFLLDDMGTRAGYHTFVRGGIAATYAYQDRLQISGTLRTDTTQLSKYLTGVPIDGTAPPVVFPGGEVRWMFTPGNSLRIFGGMTPGGRLCSGGVCREVPPFQGALAELVLRV
ncbi:MAG: hypothetical protein Q8Q09_08405 [Deltaproteobacteria bacterium]|nr:hypothetical protein [Deltaproteobacteria bacterium]